jgi:hypothetical protein
VLSRVELFYVENALPPEPRFRNHSPAQLMQLGRNCRHDRCATKCGATFEGVLTISLIGRSTLESAIYLPKHRDEFIGERSEAFASFLEML